MQDKIIPGDAQENLIKEVGQLVQVFEDRRHIKKAASRLIGREKLAEFAPPAGKFLTHAVTLGSSDQYGANRNSDDFPHEQLLARHGTFATHGRNYRNHQAHDPSLAVGEIKFAAYDPDLQRGEILFWSDIDKAAEEFENARAGREQHGSMGCFPAGTKVWMADGTEKNIEEIRAGDKVVTHKGRIREVITPTSRDYDAKAVRLRVYGLPDETETTADHLYWTRPSLKSTHVCPVCSGVFKSLKAHLRQKKDAQHQRLYKDFSRAAEGWKAAENLVPGDYVSTPFSREEEGGAEVAYARLLGWYAAEGSVFMNPDYPESQWCMEFTLNTTELEEADEIVGLLRELGVPDNQIGHYDEPARGRRRVCCRDVGMMTKVVADAAKGSSSKSLSEAVLRWPAALQMELFSRYYSGDGSATDGQGGAVTVSRKLAFDMARILWRNDIPATVASSNENREYHYVDRFGRSRVGRRKRSYSILIPAAFVHLVPSSKTPDNQLPTGGVVVSGIGHLRHQTAGAVSKPHVKQRIPRVFIEENRVYRRIRKIKHAWFTGTVHDMKVREDESFVCQGVAVHNCGIAHDLCECCGFQSKFAFQRCDHIRFHRGEYLPEFGKYAHMINIEPTFKDYSWVGRPADRIAHTLGYLLPGHLKAAGADIPDDIRSDLLAEMLSGELSVLRPLRAMHAAWGDDVAPLLKAASANVFPRAFAGQFDDKLLAKMAAHPYPARVLRSLADRDMVMPFPSFVAFATGRCLSDVENDPVVKEASAAMPAIRAIVIKRVSEDPAVGQVFNDMAKEMTPSPCCCGDEIDALFDKAREQFSTRYELLAKRSVHNPVKLASATAAVSSAAVAAGAAYQAYLCHLAGDDWMTNGVLGHAS